MEQNSVAQKLTHTHIKTQFKMDWALKISSKGDPN